MRHEVSPGIVIDTDIAVGKPMIAGTRIPVTVILGALAGGASIEGVCDAYGVTDAQVRAVLGYATQRLGEVDEGEKHTAGQLSPGLEEAFKEVFDPESPGMRYLRDH